MYQTQPIIRCVLKLTCIISINKHNQPLTLIINTAIEIGLGTLPKVFPCLPRQVLPKYANVFFANKTSDYFKKP